MAYVPTVVFDFDGVIHSYTSGWKGTRVIPDPVVPGIAEVIAKLRERGYHVAVCSSRCSTLEGVAAVAEYLHAAGIQVDDITCEKPPALVYVDDRAIRFDGTTDNLYEEIVDFAPWNGKEGREPKCWEAPTVVQGKTWAFPHCPHCGGVPCGIGPDYKFCPICGRRVAMPKT